MSEAVVLHVATGKGVAARWFEQYSRNGWVSVGRSSKRIYSRLCALGKNPKVADVDKVIGNSSWTHLTCHCCGKQVKRTANLCCWGNGVDLCLDCVKSALAVFAPKSRPRRRTPATER